MNKKIALFSLCLLISCSCASKNSNYQQGSDNMKIVADIENRAQQFSQVKLVAKTKDLTKNQQQCLEKLISAGKIIDQIFLMQAYAKNKEIKEALQGETGDLAKSARRYFKINFLPFDRLDNFKPFIGQAKAPLGANFYPIKMQKKEFNNWLKNNPLDKNDFISPFTVIRREKDKLIAVPYSQEYRPYLQKMAGKLIEAAALCSNRSLKKYLLSRASAFLSNQYQQSDIDWMDVKNNTIDVTIGPYEVYEDRLFGYKAAFEAFIGIRDSKASKELATLKKYLNELEDNLPLAKELRGPARGSESPISVVDLVFSGGDTKAGVQTIAFNLPNDEKVRALKGSKKVLLANIIKAKFEKILRPIAKEVLVTRQLKQLSGDAFVNHTLYHEVAHGMGPGKIKNSKGQQTTVSLMLKEKYSTIEEAKADIIGIYNQLWMIDNGHLPKSSLEKIYATFLAGIFRSVRFGIEEAHGQANLINFNFLLEQGAFALDKKERKYYYQKNKMAAAIKQLVAMIIQLQARGDYQGTKSFIEKYGKVTGQMKKALARLKDIAVDIEPIYPLAEK